MTGVVLDFQSFLNTPFAPFEECMKQAFGTEKAQVPVARRKFREFILILYLAISGFLLLEGAIGIINSVELYPIQISLGPILVLCILLAGWLEQTFRAIFIFRSNAEINKFLDTEIFTSMKKSLRSYDVNTLSSQNLNLKAHLQLVEEYFERLNPHTIAEGFSLVYILIICLCVSIVDIRWVSDNLGTGPLFLIEYFRIDYYIT